MCSIFADFDFSAAKSRGQIMEILVEGLKRLEYRGHESAGLAVDCPDSSDIKILKKSGKVQAESQTDTEIVAKLLLQLYSLDPECGPFLEIVERAMRRLESCESRQSIDECVTACRGSPVLDGSLLSKQIKGPEFKLEEKQEGAESFVSEYEASAVMEQTDEVIIFEGIVKANEYVRLTIRTLYTDNPPQEEQEGGELFFPSDASAGIQLTDERINFEDNDVAAIENIILDIRTLFNDNPQAINRK